MGHAFLGKTKAYARSVGEGLPVLRLELLSRPDLQCGLRIQVSQQPGSGLPVWVLLVGLSCCSGAPVAPPHRACGLAEELTEVPSTLPAGLAGEALSGWKGKAIVNRLENRDRAPSGEKRE